MISYKKLVVMVKKWQKLSAIGRRRISMPRTGDKVHLESSSISVADKGHFVVYTVDGKRFVVPLAFLGSSIFIQLLRMSEDEFGLPSSGPIMLPCDAVFMEYIISSIQRSLPKEVEEALLTSIASCRCSTSSMLNRGWTNQQILIHGF